MLRTVLMVSAYTALITIIFYLAAYSRMYDWWKSQLGIVMNASIIATGLIASGTAIRFADGDIGRILSILGWFLFSMALMWRLGILIATDPRRDRTGHEEEPERSTKDSKEDREV